MEANTAIESLDEPAPLEVERELPTRPSKQHGKVPVAEPRFQRGSVSATGFALKDPEFAHDLACSLQTPKNQEILSRLNTSQLGVRAFQGLISVSFVMNTFCLYLYLYPFPYIHAIFIFVGCLTFSQVGYSSCALAPRPLA